MYESRPLQKHKRCSCLSTYIYIKEIRIRQLCVYGWMVDGVYMSIYIQIIHERTEQNTKKKFVLNLRVDIFIFHSTIVFNQLLMRNDFINFKVILMFYRPFKCLHIIVHKFNKIRNYIGASHNNYSEEMNKPLKKTLKIVLFIYTSRQAHEQ